MQEEMPYYPPTVNDPATFQFAMDVAGRWEPGWLTGWPLNIQQCCPQPTHFAVLPACLRWCRLSDGSGGIARVGETEATMAGEDFSFIARIVPSCFTFLGTRNESLGAGE